MSWDYDSQASCGGSGPASHASRASALAKGTSDYIHGSFELGSSFADSLTGYAGACG
jgi:hypothetical protein